MAVEKQKGRPDGPNDDVEAGPTTQRVQLRMQWEADLLAAIEKGEATIQGKKIGLLEPVQTSAPAERLSIRDCLVQEIGYVIGAVLLQAKDMQHGRSQLRAAFAAYGGKEQAAYQDNELRPFADRFRQVAEAVHQELITMANRAG